MIAAETLIAPRSMDAPAVVPAAARSGVPADFAQVLAQSVKQAAATAEAPPVAPGTNATALSPEITLSQKGLATAGAATANVNPFALAQLKMAPATVVPSSVLPSALPPVGGPATAVTVTGMSATPAGPVLDAGLANSSPTIATATDAVAPDAVPVSVAATPPEATEPTQPAPDAATPAPESGQTDTPTEAAAPPPSEAPAPAETGAETATDSDDTDTPDAEPPAEPAPAAAAQPVTLPPLAALIQPLITPQNGPKGDPEDKTPGELNGSTPRQRGMAGRLTLLSEAQNPAQTQDGAASFANQLNPAQSQGPQDHLPPQGDAAQNAMAERDVTLTDTVTETSGAPTASPQPLPADTRATATPGPTPQRLPDAAPLDTTQSGWEAALTERITARPTDLGQEIEITLNPENLGHIRIKLDLSDKAATVQIVTDTPQAAHLFQQSETRLAEALNRAGLSLTSHDATSRDAGGREGGQGGQRQGQTPGNPRAEVALAGLRGTLAAPSVSGRAANLVNIVA